MDGDMSDIFQKINTALNDPDMSNNLKNILNNISPSNSDSNDTHNLNNEKIKETDSINSSNTEQNKSSATPDFDLDTIIKIKKIMDSLNSEESDARSNLLLSLKPYIADHKKEKIDQYVKLLHIAKIFELFNPLGGDNKKDV